MPVSEIPAGLERLGWDEHFEEQFRHHAEQGLAPGRVVAEHRAAYATYLWERLNGPRPWLEAAVDAQARGPRRLGPRLTHRVV